jgi:heavy metal sensor kinase
VARFSTALARLSPRKRLIRGLRFRLAASYLLFFTLLLLGLGLLFRQMLVNIAKEQANELLNEEWAAIKGYLRIEHLRALWYYDYADPEEALIVDRLKSNYLMADDNGVVLERAPFYASLKLDKADEIRARLKLLEQTQQPLVEMMYTDKGVPYLIRSGVMPDEHRRIYYIAIGRSLAEGMRTVNQFTWRYVALMPLLVLLCAVFGWMLAGRALDPVKSVAHAAQRITSSNLSTRIPTRGAGDELDYLIVAFNRMIERLNQSFEQMRQFSTDVSHELRTPLTAIRGQLEVALFTAKTPEQYQDAMVNALQDVEKLSNIVRALLLLSQAESGQLVLQIGPLDLSRLVEEVADQFQIPAEAAQLTLTCDIARDCIIRGDKTQIERLLSNLLSNALKYTPAGGKVHVTVACERQRSLDEGGNGTDRGSGMAILSVEDTGIGIPADQLPHIFDRFYRVRPSQSNPIQGLGLGLSFVSWIVKAHGGRIEVDSTVGAGTRFTVSLPLHQESPARPALEAVPQEKS